MHHNHGFAIVLVFLLSQFVHILLKAGAARNSSLNGIQSYRQYLENCGQAIASRLIFAFAILLVWMKNPDVLTVYVNGIPWVTAHLGNINLSLNAGTAFMFGYTFDSLLDKLPVAVPWLRPWLSGKEVPLKQD
jgi:hypothetical protein